jgi:hypothetical protein
MFLYSWFRECYRPLEHWGFMQVRMIIDGADSRKVIASANE